MDPKRKENIRSVSKRKIRLKDCKEKQRERGKGKRETFRFLTLKSFPPFTRVTLFQTSSLFLSFYPSSRLLSLENLINNKNFEVLEHGKPRECKRARWKLRKRETRWAREKLKVRRRLFQNKCWEYGKLKRENIKRTLKEQEN